MNKVLHQAFLYSARTAEHGNNYIINDLVKYRDASFPKRAVYLPAFHVPSARSGWRKKMPRRSYLSQFCIQSPKLYRTDDHAKLSDANGRSQNKFLSSLRSRKACSLIRDDDSDDKYGSLRCVEGDLCSKIEVRSILVTEGSSGDDRVSFGRGSADSGFGVARFSNPGLSFANFTNR